MRDRFVLPLMALTGLGLIALSLVWPQGQGARSPDPFGHPLAPLEAEAPPPPVPGLTVLPAAPSPSPAPAKSSEPNLRPEQ